MQKHWIIVLGMHRSGTSAMSGLLQSTGIEFGKDLFAADAFNPKGYWEHNELININEALLKELGASWCRPLMIRGKLASGWVPSELIKERMKNFLMSADYAELKLCALKDPRLNVLLPCWLPVFEALGHKISYVIIYRHPDAVSQSLQRTKMGAAYTEFLWCCYNLSAALYTKGSTACWISYQSLLAQPNKVLKKINENLALKLVMQQSGFIEKGLNHHQTSTSVLLPFTEKLWSHLEKNIDNLLAWDDLQVQYDIELKKLFPYLNDIINTVDELDTLRVTRENDLFALHNRLADQDTHINNLNTHIYQLGRDIGLKDQSMHSLVEQLNAKDQSMHSLVEQLNAKDQSLNHLVRITCEHEVSLTSLSELLMGNERSLNLIIEQIAVKNQSLTSLTKQIELKEQSLNSFIDITSEQGKNVTSLSELLKDNEQSLNLLIEQIAVKNESLASLTQQIELKEQLLNTIVSQLMAKEDQVLMLLEQQKNKDEYLNLLKEQLIEKDDVLDMLNQRLRSLRIREIIISNLRMIKRKISALLPRRKILNRN